MIRGSCLCGGVRYEVDGFAGPATHCHCAMCRKAHGAAFGTYATARPGAFRWTAGESLVRRYPSSPGIERTFCGVCGATLQFVRTGPPARVSVALGTLDDDPGVRPDGHIHFASRAPWYVVGEDLPVHDGDR